MRENRKTVPLVKRFRGLVVMLPFCIFILTPGFFKNIILQHKEFFYAYFSIKSGAD